ncbi:hypothetical protein A2U01_0017856 [Trifolium medium]|uniref:Uncharacterized protein n=1 Tax=Trifolium medium TaxID=97028 RepID=A0A392NAJ7_9FABA|nr:hypothetical protein [Trifolium medium]
MISRKLWWILCTAYKKKLLKKSSAFDIESDKNVEADHKVAADSSGKRKSLREIPHKDMFKRGVTTLTQTTINGIYQCPYMCLPSNSSYRHR